MDEEQRTPDVEKAKVLMDFMVTPFVASFSTS